jgi:microcystin-dependent protein
MSEPFLGQLIIFGGNFTPRGYASCNGQLLPISQNTALFSILGTTYGGNGTTTFALPDLRGRIPTHPGSTVQLGQIGGVESVTLTTAQIPAHNHTVAGTNDAAASLDPAGAYPASQAMIPPYSPGPSDVSMRADAVTSAGGGQPHTNLPPLLALTFCIALQGIFPSRN